ncbi:hypothetical protein EFE36_10360 [Lactiplantibacillus pentosus]|nr:hypothetical protein [Lactiplantibacillus pentosus]
MSQRFELFNRRHLALNIIETGQLVDPCSFAGARLSPTSGGRLTTLEQGGHRFELTQKTTAQFQIRVFF